MRAVIMCMALWLLALPAMAQPVNSAGQAGKWNEAVREVTVLRDASRADADQTKRTVREEREALSAELARLRAEHAERERACDALVAEFDALVKREDAMRRALEDRRQEMQLIEGTVRGAARQMRERALNSPVTAERPERLPTLDSLLETGRFPGLAGIRSLADMFLDEMKAAGEVTKRQGAWIAEDGSERTGTVVRLGALGAAYLGEDGAGFLRPAADGALEAVPGDLDGAVRAMRRFAEGERPDAPLDFSGGEVFRRFETGNGILAMLGSGGFLVWPILLVGVLGLGLACERFWTLWRIRVCRECRMNKAFVWAGRGDIEKCASCLGTKGSTPTCRVLSHVILHSGGTLVSMEKGLQEAILQELPKLERFLPTMSILAAVAPLLGLLGTVTGMIDTFQVITVFGAGDARMMSGGISEALITTQLGLAVAVPLTLVHHFLERKVDRIVADMEEKGTTLVARLVSAGGGR
ncbi:biopolymer transport protein ExbB [Desulfobaculum xiamenense]|uniref:Biopolymer transport protein ExbB n=1 Tax=Desulfobaculum xiamenense TaxID=995050 RepID=A0A846QI12_9BACT|nr:MotA/TolQ/ExbB proton channel family protein [Desulfobaculum xiamenense]NJB66677.1 biopolymer transport protein ExbB [Desulfobaculum xiamenense]